MGVVGLAMLAACGAPTAASPDAPPPPVQFTLHVETFTPQRAAQPSVVIDGVMTSTLEQTYADEQEAVSVEHHAQLRYQDQLLIDLPVGLDTSCAPPGGTPGHLLTASVTLVAYESGDLRYYSDAIQLDNAGCLGDAFAVPRCGCAATERCTPRIALADPLFTHLDCAPIGPKQHGDACTQVPDPAGAYDDCGAGLFCYQGTCHLLCVPGWVGNGAGATALPEGYPPDALLCD